MDAKQLFGALAAVLVGAARSRDVESLHVAVCYTCDTVLYTVELHSFWPGSDRQTIDRFEVEADDPESIDALIAEFTDFITAHPF
jgi:hypothetical protein